MMCSAGSYGPPLLEKILRLNGQIPGQFAQSKK